MAGQTGPVRWDLRIGRWLGAVIGWTVTKTIWWLFVLGAWALGAAFVLWVGEGLLNVGRVVLGVIVSGLGG